MIQTSVSNMDRMPWGPGIGAAGEGGPGGEIKADKTQGCILKMVSHTTKLCLTIWTLTLTLKELFSTMMESPPLPLPTLYCISQASPIMGFTLRPVTRGGGPAPLLTMAPWGPKRLRCCTVSMPPPPATPPSSTYTARINLRTQVCICASISSTFWTFFRLIHDIIPFSLSHTF